MGMRIGLALLVVCVASPIAAEPTLSAPAELLLGDESGIVIRGATPGEIVRLHALRQTMVPAGEGKPARALLLHAWADYRAGRDGSVAIDTSVPIAGTYDGADPLGLLWSGWPLGSQKLAGVSAEGLGAEQLADNTTLVLTLESNAQRSSPRRVALLPAAKDLSFTELTVAKDGVSGVLAMPTRPARLPAIIQLHGSEGGSMAGARARAALLASRGYAVLALNYVAYPYVEAIDGVSPAFTNIAVELLDKARAALAARPQVDPARIALVGGSKGAELALVGATTYPWVKAVVACVPSDIVWAGFGRAPTTPDELLSSWSVGGRPLPYVAYDRYEDVFTGKATAAEVHRRSRAQASPALLKQSRIPVERIRAPVLLLGSGEDEVWQSREMAGVVATTLRRSRGFKAAELAVYSGAGHGICGTGSAPARTGDEDRSVTIRAAGDAFRRTRAFLDRSLR